MNLRFHIEWIIISGFFAKAYNELVVFNYGQILNFSNFALNLSLQRIAEKE